MSSAMFVSVHRRKRNAKSRLRLQVEEDVSPSLGRVLRLRLTDPNDALFYYGLVLNESDFAKLKASQGLIVDFGPLFIKMIRELCEKCNDEDEKRPEAPTFKLTLDEDGEGRVEFLEINSFRHLCHLSLQVRRGSDAQIKEYLAECLEKLTISTTATQSDLEKRLQSLEEVLNSTKSALDEKTKTLNEMEMTAKERMSVINAAKAEEMAEFKRQATDDVAKMQSAFEKERREFVEESAKQKRLKDDRIASLEYVNRDLEDRRRKNEAAILRLTDQLKLSQEETTKLQRDVQQKRSEFDKADSETVKKERLVQQLQNRITVLEQDKRCLETEMRRQKDLLEAVGAQKNLLEKDLAEKTALVARREQAAKNVSHDLIKANQIIQKFQDHSKAEHDKVKLAAKVIEEQEKVLADKDKEMNALREELRTQAEFCSEQKIKAAEMEAEAKMTDGEKAELEKKIQTNEKVIQWLNKQLTTAQARDPGLRLAPPPEGLTFTPSAMNAMSTPVSTKENKGLDDKYLPRTLRNKNASLPSNVGNARGAAGGLLRRPDQAKSLTPTNIDSVYFPRT